MDFGEILEEWEKKKKKGNTKKSREKTGESRSNAHTMLEKWLDSQEDWESIRRIKEQEEQDNAQGSLTRSLLKKMAPQDTLDLHGVDVKTAESMLARFLSSAYSRNLKKVLIIHGKGTHSPEGPVLRTAVRDFLQRSELAGETGTPGRELGGSGATWVILKKKTHG